MKKLIIALMFANTAVAGPYVGIHQMDREFRDEGRVDSWADQRGCLSCKQTTADDKRDPFGMVFGYRQSHGNWFIDGSVFINETGEYKRTSSKAHSVYNIDTWGLHALAGRKLPHGFSVGVGMASTFLDAKVYTWSKGDHESYSVSDNTHSAVLHVDWTSKFGTGVYARYITETGTVDGFGKKPMILIGVSQEF